MKDHLPLINRAIAMHLLREGQFSVASTFIEEAGSDMPKTVPTAQEPAGQDVDMDDDGPRQSERHPDGHLPPSLHPEELQAKFAEMYSILQELKARNLVPAIDWARRNSREIVAADSCSRRAISTCDRSAS